MKGNIIQAIGFASMKHKGQKRSDGKDYITHPVSVYEILTNVTENEDILIASILHDTVEDTKTTYDEIVELFGEGVGDYVMEVTKNTIDEAKYDIKTKGGLLIKLADMLHNASDDDPKIRQKMRMIRMERGKK